MSPVFTAREQAELSLRTMERALDAARFAEKAARHDLAQARAALTRYESGAPAAKWPVTSPVGGVVLKVAQKSESAVVLGAPLLEVADPRTLEAVVDVLSQEAVGIRPRPLASRSSASTWCSTSPSRSTACRPSATAFASKLTSSLTVKKML